MIRVARAAAARYRSVPASVLYPQLFLGFGWIRAAVAHGISLSWWSGEDLLRFLDSTEALRLPVYGPFVDYLVRPLPILVSVIVVVLQLLIGLALLANVRPVTWALVGIFLNFNFIMAGAVNPSVFYVVMGMAVVLWIMLDRMTAERAYRMATRATVVAAITVVVCGPFTTTLDPARVIEDPSLILICLSSLFAVSCWLTYGELTGDGDLEVVGAGRGEPVRAGALLPAHRDTPPPTPRSRGARRSSETSTSLETDLQELRAASPAEIMEAMDRPIPRLPSRGTMTYHEDVDSGFSITDESGTLAAKGNGSTQAPDKRRLIANFEVNDDPPLQWYSVRCHFRIDERHYERVDHGVAGRRVRRGHRSGRGRGRELRRRRVSGSCDCFHCGRRHAGLPGGRDLLARPGLRPDPDTYLRAFFFTGSERSAEV